MKKIVLPKLGQTMEEAVLESWRVKEGDTVASGDVIAEITTDKATLEVQSFHDGTVRKILAAPGDTVPVNALIALIGDPDEAISEDLLKAPAPAVAPAPEADKTQPSPARTAPATAAAVAPAPQEHAPSGRVFISPRARRLAEADRIPPVVLRGSGPNGRVVEKDVLAYRDRLQDLRLTPMARELAYERGVDLLTLTGTGTDGRITQEDVEAAAQATPAAGRKEPLTAMRRIVADRMAQSKREIPHYYLTIEIDMTRAVDMRTRLNASGDLRISFNDLIARAAAIAVREVPEINARWEDDGIFYKGAFNVGIAVGLDAGLIVPVVRNADRKSLTDIARTSADLIARARSKKLTPDEYEGGSLTITNLGMFEIDNFVPVINPGEAVILGVGRIADRPAVIDGGIHVAKMMNITLSGDHRTVDGARAALFLRTLKELLESPDALTA